METAHLLTYIYPNERIVWTLMIVLYPYITGLVAGAFIISSLHSVFGVKAVEPVAKFSLVAALCFLMFATTPLLLHLGHPERAFHIMFTPNFRSAMAGFGFIYTFYFVLVALELWLIFRPFLVQRARQGGPRSLVYRVLCLGVYDIPAAAMKLDAKVIAILAGLGIPAACILHGYVGFIFGAIKANPWWSSPLTPVIFILSAMVSGVALIIISYWIACKVRCVPVDHSCMRSLSTYLWGFLIIDVSMELLELLSLVYESTEDWTIISEMMRHRIGSSLFGAQFLVGSLIPLLLLGWIVIYGVKGRKMEFSAYFASFLLLLQVLAMRWNVVVGGQSFSKSFIGLLEYELEFFGREGLFMGISLLVAPLVLLVVLSRWLPVWPKSVEPRPVMAP